MGVMASCTGEEASLSCRVFSALHRMTSRPETPDDMYAVPDTVFRVACYAEVVNGLHERKYVIRRMRAVAVRTHAGPNRSVNIFLSEHPFIMAHIAQLRGLINEALLIIRSMRVVAGHAHPGCHGGVLMFLREHPFIMARIAQLRGLTHEGLRVVRSMRVVAGRAHPGCNG